MTKGGLFELLKDVPDNAVILIYDQYEDIPEEECLTDGSGNPLDENDNPYKAEPGRCLRYPDKVLPSKAFEKELEFLGEDSNTVILRLL